MYLIIVPPLQEEIVGKLVEAQRVQAALHARGGAVPLLPADLLRSDAAADASRLPAADETEASVGRGRRAARRRKRGKRPGPRRNKRACRPQDQQQQQRHEEEEEDDEDEF